MNRLLRAIRAAAAAAVDEWRETRVLRKAKVIISDDGHLLRLEFPGMITLRERNQVRRELVAFLVAGGYWNKPAVDARADLVEPQ